MGDHSAGAVDRPGIGERQQGGGSSFQTPKLARSTAAQTPIRGRDMPELSDVNRGMLSRMTHRS